MKLARLITASTAAMTIAACAPYAQEPAAGVPVAVEAPDESQDLSALFEEYDQAQLALSPLSKSYRGIRDEDYARWGDFSDAAEIASQELTQSTAARMRENFALAELPEEDQLSYRLFDAMAERSAARFAYRRNGYIFDQMNGSQSGLPAFLINIHRVSNTQQAAAYVSRIEGLGDVLDTLIAESRSRANAGVMPPDWVYPYVISDIENLLAAGDDNAVLEDFREKVTVLEIDDETKTDLVESAEAAWQQSARPAYERLLAEMKRQQQIAPTDDGVWRLDDGAAYYQTLLKSYTTTDLTADEIHNIGLREVERIHGEMREIMDEVGFEGSLQDFFQYTRTNDRFFYETREAYLADAEAKLEAMEEKLPQFFATLPTDPLVIKPVEAFREKSAGKAFYQRPAPDGSRPGTYYVNLYNLRDMSKNELEALAYHEGLPGHHLQLSIQTQLGEVPPFRRFGGITAYSEGWGLYSEELGKDMGFYTDPYSDFGRLGMELWRACRLVVDTGIHHKRWSREEAIQYLTDNTPNPDGDIRKAIERYIVYPGQATAYMIGKLKIMELRDRARQELGEDFDIRGFHDAILTSGPVPLDIMEENVEKWIAGAKQG
ncbi:Uncharacterized conserved protein, DUF885 familyt [Altererythrobacter xiamenensis]|uniref:Uncharacterized conserved protein, DUF885 familyt n=1 Tax=Altererythrobacter xiamenensis TaxID=1316679 RepID=A0A1Y6F992_9SPHN|nr:DUF885 domain-containing protein [Altererythrobacter xiamenensis]SMQ68943.1 Uncharacterized conserved protein, DUF885 familyt [Altererythrobacter xiamenensis]